MWGKGRSRLSRVDSGRRERGAEGNDVGNEATQEMRCKMDTLDRDGKCGQLQLIKAR